MKQSRFHKQFFTLPNILSYLRFSLIPVFLWIYCGKGNYTLAAWLMAISAATDVIDGWIARQFHLVTDWGKIIDPFADKLTQIAIAFCLAWRYPTVWFLLGFLVAKEFYMGLIGLIFIKKTATVLFFLISLIMLVAPSLPLWSIQLMVGLECAVLLVSMILYSLRYQRLYRSLPRKS